MRMLRDTSERAAWSSPTPTHPSMCAFGCYTLFLRCYLPPHPFLATHTMVHCTTPPHSTSSCAAGIPGLQPSTLAAMVARVRSKCQVSPFALW